MGVLPDDDEITTCINIMNRIEPGNLHTLSPLLLEAGHALFGRSIKISLFGEEEVVAFFKQKEDYKSLLRKLERVHSEVQRAHANYVEVCLSVLQVLLVVMCWQYICSNLKCFKSHFIATWSIADNC